MPYITSEDDFLALIAASFPNTHETLILGRGDDCAEITCPPHMAVSTDLFVEDVHFRSQYFTPFETGYKALAVNISDMAAAGAKPLGISVGLIAPSPFPKKTAAGIIDGMAQAVREYDLALTGGDLSLGEKLAFCVTIWGGHGSGEGAPPQKGIFLRRGPVSPGDTLFLCGQAGLARAGLLLLEKDGRDASRSFPAACKAHLMPTPLVSTGLALISVPGCRLMDVSDGLARDLPRMLNAYGSKYGASIYLTEENLHPEVAAFAGSISEDPCRFAFTGGEDYALLGACPSDKLPLVAQTLERAVPETPFHVLGVVTGEHGISLNGVPFADNGFDHFRTFCHKNYPER